MRHKVKNRAIAVRTRAMARIQRAKVKMQSAIGREEPGPDTTAIGPNVDAPAFSSNFEFGISHFAFCLKTSSQKPP
jgi:hypothetical protein